MTGAPQNRRACYWDVQGLVQGVGFRPLAARLAVCLNLRGWVRNDPAGAALFLVGGDESIHEFQRRLVAELPPSAQILQICERPAPLPEDLPEGFEIRQSVENGLSTAGILADLGTCSDCLAELFDPADRRYRYPFINCTHCGPRYSILEGLPYDRVKTTMRDFVMCPLCQAEYDNPQSRRFHAQPNACPVCGPQLSWWDAKGRLLAEKEAAVGEALQALQDGKIVAVKGIGGFQLLVDARHEAAVQRLRIRKRRPMQPFAVMFASREQLFTHCTPEEGAADVLLSPAAPIVLLPKAAAYALCKAVAPGLTQVGAFLPYTPLHHVLLHELNFPLVATSGNLHEEPICVDNDEALLRLHGIADYFLMHDRRIVRPMDDSVCMMFNGGMQPIRRARGLAPYSLPLPGAPDGLLAAGGDLKGTVGLATDGRVTLSPHLGDLAHSKSIDLWHRSIKDLLALRRSVVQTAVVDEHPDYHSTRAVELLHEMPLSIQHHHAHVAACLGEHCVTEAVLGIVWDGAGWGDDGSVWGGEFLLASPAACRRVGHLRPFPLLGGDAAAKEPRRIAFALAAAAGIEPPAMDFSSEEIRLLSQMQESGLCTTQTTSMGRLFDGVAALAGVCLCNTYEGEAAMRLEARVKEGRHEPYSFQWDDAALDWGPMIREMLVDDVVRVPSRFHATLCAIALSAATRFQHKNVCLSGGCFQNKWLLTACVKELEQAGFRVLLSRATPVNDAGLAYGQAVAAVARLCS